MPVVRLLSVEARAATWSRAELAAVIAEQRPDIACVHGAPGGPRWRTMCGALARESGLVVVGGGRPAGRTLLLSSLAVDVLATRDVRLDESRPRRRGAAATLAFVRRGAAGLLLAGARLTGDPAARQAQAEALVRAVADFALDARPAVLCVAGLDGPDDPAASALSLGRTAVAGRAFIDDAIKLSAAADSGPVTTVELEPTG